MTEYTMPLSTQEQLLLTIHLHRSQQAARFLFMCLCCLGSLAIIIMIVMAIHIQSATSEVKNLKYTREGLLSTIGQLQQENNELRTKRSRDRAADGAALLP